MELIVIGALIVAAFVYRKKLKAMFAKAKADVTDKLDLN